LNQVLQLFQLDPLDQLPLIDHLIQMIQ
jgi:hypothetical protein